MPRPPSPLAGREMFFQTSLNNAKFGLSILSKIVRIGATRYSRFQRKKRTEFDFRCGSAPDPVGGHYSAPQNSSWN